MWSQVSWALLLLGTLAQAEDEICKVVTVGPSFQNNVKSADEKGVTVCDEKRVNPDYADATDSFTVTIHKDKITVTRSDPNLAPNTGWGMNLQFKCCGDLTAVAPCGDWSWLNNETCSGEDGIGIFKGWPEHPKYDARKSNGNTLRFFDASQENSDGGIGYQPKHTAMQKLKDDCAEYCEKTGECGVCVLHCRNSGWDDRQIMNCRYVALKECGHVDPQDHRVSVPAPLGMYDRTKCDPSLPQIPRKIDGYELAEGSGCVRGNDISCGNYDTTNEAAQACQLDETCKGFSMRDIGSGLAPWCLKKAINHTFNDLDSHHCYVKDLYYCVPFELISKSAYCNNDRRIDGGTLPATVKECLDLVTKQGDKCADGKFQYGESGCQCVDKGKECDMISPSAQGNAVYGVKNCGTGQRTVTFKPAKMGITFRGRKIVSVQKGTQAYDLGVESGWEIMEIAGDPAVTYQDVNKMLSAAKQGGNTFDVVFKIPNTQSSGGAGPGNTECEEFDYDEFNCKAHKGDGCEWSDDFQDCYSIKSSPGQTWAKCATESGHSKNPCACTGTVRFGAGEAWVYDRAAGTIPCSNSQFGDPAPNKPKECWCKPDKEVKCEYFLAKGSMNCTADTMIKTVQDCKLAAGELGYDIHATSMVEESQNRPSGCFGRNDGGGYADFNKNFQGFNTLKIVTGICQRCGPDICVADCDDKCGGVSDGCGGSCDDKCPCQDTNSDCSFWSKNKWNGAGYTAVAKLEDGECYRNKDYMKKNCPLACGFCSKENTQVPTDKYTLAVKGDCAAQRKINTKENCETAAKALGLPATRVSWSGSYNWVPTGCSIHNRDCKGCGPDVVNGGTLKLHWNMSPTGKNNGDYDALCKSDPNAPGSASAHNIDGFNLEKGSACISGNDISCGYYNNIDVAAAACSAKPECKAFSTKNHEDGKGMTAWCLKSDVRHHYNSNLPHDCYVKVQKTEDVDGYETVSGSGCGNGGAIQRACMLPNGVNVTESSCRPSAASSRPRAQTAASDKTKYNDMLRRDEDECTARMKMEKSGLACESPGGKPDNKCTFVDGFNSEDQCKGAGYVWTGGCGDYATLKDAAEACNANGECRGFSTREFCKQKCEMQPWCLKKHVQHTFDDIHPHNCYVRKYDVAVTDCRAIKITSGQEPTVENKCPTGHRFASYKEVESCKNELCNSSDMGYFSITRGTGVTLSGPGYGCKMESGEKGTDLLCVEDAGVTPTPGTAPQAASDTPTPGGRPSSEPGSAPATCTDMVGWLDSARNGCETWGEKGWCSLYGDRSYPKGVPNDACCACGGGKTSGGASSGEDDCDYIANVANIETTGNGNCEYTCSVNWEGAKCDIKSSCDSLPGKGAKWTSVAGNKVDGCIYQCTANWQGETCDEKSPCDDVANMQSKSGNKVDANCTYVCTSGTAGFRCGQQACDDVANMLRKSGNTADGCNYVCANNWKGAQCRIKTPCDDIPNTATKSGNKVDNNCAYGCSTGWEGPTCDFKTQTQPKVNCGGHYANTCAACPTTSCPQGDCGRDFCNGDCAWRDGKCVKPDDCSGVTCDPRPTDCPGRPLEVKTAGTCCSHWVCQKEEDNDCVCGDGIPATGVDCPEDNMELCSECNTGFHLVDSKIADLVATCEVNECSCDNGSGAIATQCPEHGKNRCSACNQGYNNVNHICLKPEEECQEGTHKEGAECKQNACTCEHGTGARGSLCATHGSEWCSACAQDYDNVNHVCEPEKCALGTHGSQGKCEVNVCKCERGTGSRGLSCETHDSNMCASCDRGYDNENSVCAPEKCGGLEKHPSDAVYAGDGGCTQSGRCEVACPLGYYKLGKDGHILCNGSAIIAGEVPQCIKSVQDSFTRTKEMKLEFDGMTSEKFAAVTDIFKVAGADLLNTKWVGAPATFKASMIVLPDYDKKKNTRRLADGDLKAAPTLSTQSTEALIVKYYVTALPDRSAAEWVEDKSASDEFVNAIEMRLWSGIKTRGKTSPLPIGKGKTEVVGGLEGAKGRTQGLTDAAFQQGNGDFGRDGNRREHDGRGDGRNQDNSLPYILGGVAAAGALLFLGAVGFCCYTHKKSQKLKETIKTQERQIAVQETQNVQVMDRPDLVGMYSAADGYGIPAAETTWSGQRRIPDRLSVQPIMSPDMGPQRDLDMRRLSINEYEGEAETKHLPHPNVNARPINEVGRNGRFARTAEKDLVRGLQDDLQRER